MNASASVSPHKVVSQEKWLEARRGLLNEEKQLTRQQQRVAAARGELPWTKVTNDYVFDAPNGRMRLADLFDGRSQLIVKHNMLNPTNDVCIGCSLEMDAIEGARVLQGGKTDDPEILTASDGSYSIEMTYPGYGVPGVIAVKEGHRTNGLDIYQVPTEPVTLTLYSYSGPDNPAYEYGDPGHGDDPSSRFCGHCHATFAQKFQTSKHARSADNPLTLLRSVLDSRCGGLPSECQGS